MDLVTSDQVRFDTRSSYCRDTNELRLMNGCYKKCLAFPLRGKSLPGGKGSWNLAINFNPCTMNIRRRSISISAKMWRISIFTQHLHMSRI